MRWSLDGETVEPGSLLVVLVSRFASASKPTDLQIEEPETVPETESVPDTPEVAEQETVDQTRI